MEALETSENKISYARQLYNSTVAAYDNKLQTFPSNLVAGIHHFEKYDYLDAPEEARKTPKVEF